MTEQVLLAIPDGTLASEAAALVAETEGFSVFQTTVDSAGAGAAVTGTELCAAILHESLGPIPVMDLARELTRRSPQVGLILLVRDKTPEVLEQALHAGFRDVVALPLGLEALGSALTVASSWSRALRASISTDIEITPEGVGGSMIVMAGAKGGVGTTTLAVHLALQAARAGTRSVCLVDFDLQTGDVGHLIDMTHRRSIGDLIEMADQLSARHVESTLFLHPSGLRVMLAPPEGEQEEDITVDLARRIFGHLKFRYDVVIVDVGSVTSDPTAVAVEMADQALIVTTPDGPSMRGANRLVSLWERLKVRKRDDISVVVNMSSKDTDVQVGFLRKEIVAPCLHTVVPSAFRDIELAMNTGVPDRLTDGSMRSAIASLAVELGIVAKSGKKKKAPAAAGETGSIAVETTGLTFMIGMVVLLLWQIALVGWTFVMAGHSAREAARELAVGGDVRRAAESDLPDSFKDDLVLEEGESFVEVRLRVPMLVPWLGSPLEIDARAGTVVEDDPEPAWQTSPEEGPSP